MEVSKSVEADVELAKDFELRLIMACFTNVSWWVVDELFEFQLDAKGCPFVEALHYPVNP